jgi:hypothetical protein
MKDATGGLGGMLPGFKLPSDGRPQMTCAGFRYAFWIKHALVLIAAIALLWLAG